MEKRKKSDSFYKPWEIFKPFIIYYVVYNIAFLLIAYACSSAAEYFGGGLREYLTENAETLTQMISGLSMLAGVLPLMPMLRQELDLHKESAKNQTFLESENNKGTRRKAWSAFLSVLLTFLLAVSSSVGLNILLALTGLVQASESYQDVADRQYSVVFGVGAVLFGLISPIAEEIVFRGLVFNRMRRYYPVFAAIVVSGILFGVYHGNLVQGIYGGCMGILLAYTYERLHSFLIPCLFHAAANLTVYTLTDVQTVYQGLQEVIYTVPSCITLLIISAACIFIIERRFKCAESLILS